jgi:putative transcriptional regulator
MRGQTYRLISVRKASKQERATHMATVKVTPEIVERAIDQTDWVAQDALTDEDIARQIASNPDAAAVLTDAETAASIVRIVRKHLGNLAGRFRRSLSHSHRHAA